MSGTFEPKNTLSEFLPVNVVWPDTEDTKEFGNRIQQIYRRIADGVNNREIGNYIAVTPSAGTVTTVEAITGQEWFGAGSETQSLIPRVTFRKVINFGVLPNNSTTSVAHGITFDLNSTMTKIYGAATDPSGPTFIPIPTSEPPGLTGNISIIVDGTNVNITTETNRTNFTRTIIVLEYLKNL